MNHWSDGLRAALAHLQMLPFAVLSAVALPLLALSAYRRIYPAAPLYWAAVAPFVLALLLLLPSSDWALAAVFAVDVAIVLVAVYDLWSLPAVASFTCERQTTRIASLQKGHRVTLVIANQSSRRRRLWVRDDAPQEFETKPGEFALRIEPRSRLD